MMLAWLSSSEMTASSGPAGLEQAAVGVKAGRVEDRVLGAQELAEFCFQFFVKSGCRR